MRNSWREEQEGDNDWSVKKRLKIMIIIIEYLKGLSRKGL